MRKILKLFAISTFVLFAVNVYGQNIYYQTEKGNIYNAAQYAKQKQEFVESLKKNVSKNVTVKENLTKLRENKDSVLMAFVWEVHIGKISKRDKREEEMKNALIGKKFPFEKLTNNNVNLSDLKGKPTLINLWFTRCRPCLEEIPALNAIKNKYNSQANFIALTFENEKKVQALLQKREFNYTHLTNEKKFLKEIGINTYPVNILLDKNGVVVKINDGIPIGSKGEELESDLKGLF